MAHISEVEAARVVRMAEQKGEFVILEDGFVYFWPDGSHCGAISSWQLRVLADEIDRRNDPIQELISDYFEGKES